MHILTNGNVRTQRDVVDNLLYTSADGAMVAEAISADPALFLGCLAPASDYLSAPSPLQLARLYLSYARECSVGLGWSADEQWLRLVGHVHRVAGAELRRLQLEPSIEQPCSLEALDAALRQAEERAGQEVRGDWQADPAIECEMESSRERRQRSMEVIRTRARQRERMGAGEEAANDISSCTRPLNSKERNRKRRREEKAAQREVRGTATSAAKPDDG